MFAECFGNLAATRIMDADKCNPWFIYFRIFGFMHILSSDPLQDFYDLIGFENLAIRNNFSVYNQRRGSHHTVSSNLCEISHMIDCRIHTQLFECSFCCSFKLITFRTAAS